MPTPLPMSEEVRLRWILDVENLTVSRGYINSGKVTITEGLLKGSGVGGLPKNLNTPTVFFTV